MERKKQPISKAIRPQYTPAEQATAAALPTMLELQRIVGNRRVTELVQRNGKKRKASAPLTPSLASTRKKRKVLAPLLSVPLIHYENYGGLLATGVGTEEYATSAEVVLGPMTWYGSGPDQSIMPLTMQQLDAQLPTANKWIRGHLFNDNLGGSGKDNDNLAPMSHTTNQQWNRAFEAPMKKATSMLSGFYFSVSTTDYFVLIGYKASASGTYGPANALGITIPAQFTGDYYFAAYDRAQKTVVYDNTSVEAALKELGSTRQAVEGLLNPISGGIIINQTH